MLSIRSTSLRLLVCILVLTAGLILSSPGLASVDAQPLETSDSMNDCTGIVVDPVNESYMAEVVTLVNQERAAENLAPLKRVDELDYAAQAHAQDMGVDNYMAHNSQSPDCVWSDRVSNYYSGWNYLGENIASGHQSPEVVMDAWMNSSGHRANILNESICEIGVGYYPDGLYGTSWVQDFGCRQNISKAYQIIIEGDTAAVSTQYVTLYIYGTWSEMRLRNDDGEWTEWMTFSNQVDWELPDESGTHTVTVEVRDSGEVYSSSDSIRLDLPVFIDYPNSLFLPLISSQ